MDHPRPRTDSVRLFAMCLVAIALIGCAGAKELEHSTTPANSAKSRHMLALGDSYTIGESVAEPQRWPMQLAKMLRDEGVELAAPKIIARTGWTTGELLSGIESAPPTRVFDVVSLQIGVNNQFRGLEEKQYAAELDLLFDKAIAFAGGDASKVIVLSIPDWGVTPFAEGRDRDKIAAEIDHFNQLCRDLTNARGCHFIDVTPISREAPDDPALLAEDGLHPSETMYRRWCELALPAAKRALSATATE